MVPAIYGLIKNGISSKAIRYISMSPLQKVNPSIDNRLKALVAYIFGFLWHLVTRMEQVPK